MYQKDFILRMIERFADFIAGIFGLLKKGEFDQASQAIDNAYYNFLKEDAFFFRIIPKEKLTYDLISKHNYTNGHLEILAGLFYAEAELRFAKGNITESIEFYEKALLLYEFTERESQIFSTGKQLKMTDIKIQISKLKNTTF
jgi:tetratricopeptide (TPR) repeat protein